MDKRFLIIGIIVLLGGGVLISISVIPIVDESIPAFDEFSRKFIAPEPPVRFNYGETVTARFDVTGIAPERDVVFGITTSSSWYKVRLNSSIIKETFTAEFSGYIS